MTYNDGDIVNGHRFDAASNSWIPVDPPAAAPLPPPTTPAAQLPPPTTPTPAAAAAAPAKSNKKVLLIGGGVLAAVALVIGIGAANSSPSSPASSPSTPIATPSSTPSDTPTPEESTPEPVDTGNPLAVKDVSLALKITSKKCFGSAGCNVEYRIKPSATVGQPFDATYEVTFSIKGDESGPVIGSFTVAEDGSIEDASDLEGLLSTPRASTKVTVKVTSVEKV